MNRNHFEIRLKICTTKCKKLKWVLGSAVSENIVTALSLSLSLLGVTVFTSVPNVQGAAPAP